MLLSSSGNNRLVPLTTDSRANALTALVEGGGGGGGEVRLSIKMIKNFTPANNVLSFAIKVLCIKYVS